MKIRELIDFLLDFDPDMEVAILSDGEDFLPICEMASDMIEMEDVESGEKENLFVLCPCYGNHDEDEQPEVSTQNPQLN